MTDWRTWLLFVFTSNDAAAQAMSDDELRLAVCRAADAAPDLLNALKVVVLKYHERNFECGYSVDDEISAQAHAAIAKAEGAA